MKKVLPVRGRPEDVAKLKAGLGMLFPDWEIEVVSGPVTRRVCTTSVRKKGVSVRRERRSGHERRRGDDRRHAFDFKIRLNIRNGRDRRIGTERRTASISGE